MIKMIKEIISEEMETEKLQGKLLAYREMILHCESCIESIHERMNEIQNNMQSDEVSSK